MDYAAIKEARDLLGEEFDWIPDVSMDLMVKCFDRIAYLLIQEAEYESDK